MRKYYGGAREAEEPRPNRPVLPYSEIPAAETLPGPSSRAVCARDSILRALVQLFGRKVVGRCGARGLRLRGATELGVFAYAFQACRLCLPGVLGVWPK